jgi:hypothetical protein
MCLGNYCYEYVVILGKFPTLTPYSGTYSGLYAVHVCPSPKGIMPGAGPGMMSEIGMG